MANTRSAAKQARKATRRRALNRKTKDSVRQATKQIKTLIKEGKKDDAQKFFSDFQSILDRAAKTKRVHKNTASRKTSRIAKLLKAEAPAPTPVKSAPSKAKAASKAKKK